MPTGLLVPFEVDDIATFSRQAESRGYDSVWTGELWEQDAFVALTLAREPVH
jgi:alkanesulfonate monooxygenase SsuD/methylene tetrahydromethanopterin reductase-like flavin-dependent oxidoreductase (luciferase family)